AESVPPLAGGARARLAPVDSDRRLHVVGILPGPVGAEPRATRRSGARPRDSCSRGRRLGRLAAAWTEAIGDEAVRRRGHARGGCPARPVGLLTFDGAGG